MIPLRQEATMISFIAPIYKYHPVLLSSLLTQQNPDWECILIHDTPNPDLRKYVEFLADPRIKYHETAQRYNDWGHSLRALGLTMLGDSQFVVHTNADNYYCPGFINAMLSAAEGYLGAYCDCVHSHRGWQMMSCALKFTFIDCGCVMLRRQIAEEVGWTSRDFAADWNMIDQVIARYGSEVFNHVSLPLFVHN
jgi:hypothetical protein